MRCWVPSRDANASTAKRAPSWVSTRRRFARSGKHDPNLVSNLCKSDQHGTSITYGERFIVKLFRRVEPGRHPELEMGQFFSTLKEPPHVAQLAGWLEYRPRDGEVLTLGVAHEFICNETSAWNFTLDTLGVYFETALAQEGSQLPGNAVGISRAAQMDEPLPDAARTLMGSYLDRIELLGRRTAEIHVALASSENPDFVPEPFTEFYRMGLYHSLLGQKNRTVQLLRTSIAELPDEAREDADLLLRREAEINQLLQRFRDRKLGGKRIRIHGDYDLRQILFTGKDFYVIDFEGEVERPLSERRIRRSPLRDVAGILQSLYFASHGALYGHVPGQVSPDAAPELLEALADRWWHWATAELVRGYLATPQISALLPATPEDIRILLDTLVIENALREIDQDVINRKERARLAVRSLLRVLDSQTHPENIA